MSILSSFRVDAISLARLNHSSMVVPYWKLKHKSCYRRSTFLLTITLFSLQETQKIPIYPMSYSHIRPLTKLSTSPSLMSTLWILRVSRNTHKVRSIRGRIMMNLLKLRVRGYKTGSSLRHKTTRSSYSLQANGNTYRFMQRLDPKMRARTNQRMRKMRK